MQFQSTFVPCFIYSEKDGPYTTHGHQPFHLRQNKLDGACGQHCLFMALLALGVVTRKQLNNIDDLDCKTELGKVWKAAKKSFFEGTVGKNLKQILHPLRAKVECVPMHPKTHNLRDTVIEELHEDSLLIAGMKNKDMAHWTLIVGIKGIIESDGVGHEILNNKIQHCEYSRARFEPTEFLILDPSGDPLPYLPWNVCLGVDARPGGHRDVRFMYDHYDEESTVRIDELVVLRRR